MKKTINVYFLIGMFFVSAIQGQQKRTRVSLDQEAQKVAQDFWRKYLIRCGNSYYFQPNPYLIFEHKDVPEFNTTGHSLQPKSLSRSDVLNGVDPLPIEWEGHTTVGFEIARRYDITERRWEGWSSVEANLRMGFKRSKGKWSFEQIGQTVITCSDIDRIKPRKP